MKVWSLRFIEKGARSAPPEKTSERTYLYVGLKPLAALVLRAAIAKAGSDSDCTTSSVGWDKANLVLGRRANIFGRN